MQANPGTPVPGGSNRGGFGAPTAGTFAAQCVAAGQATNLDRRFGITLYSQAIMRMQSPAVLCEINDDC
jgi:hypothetical protein